jgi:hypothetical protein
MCGVGWGVWRTVGDPLEAYRDFQVARDFLSRMRSKRYGAMVELFSEPIRRGIRDPDAWVPKNLPEIRSFSLKSIRRQEAFGNGHEVSFSIESDGASRIDIFVAGSGGRRVVVFTMPPGL